jgi:CubicO group peptidase (beta-lactamase class C family)
MKSVLYFTFFLSALVTNCFGQNLANTIGQIATEYDMMGGSLVVFCDNEFAEEVYWGESDDLRNIPTDFNTKYRIASISKTITAIAVMQLVQESELDLDDDIDSILGYNIQNPSYPSIAITPRMLLSHTSGIIDGSTYSSFLAATSNGSVIPNLSQLLVSGGSYYSTSLFNAIMPGTYFNYSNLNYVILGTIVEKVSGVRFDTYCVENIFEPLGIDASFNPADLDDINQLAVLYRKVGGVWTPQVDNFQGVPPSYSNLEGYIPGTNGARFGPQGSLRCSARDLALIFMCLLDMEYCSNILLQGQQLTNMLEQSWTYNGNNGNNYFGLFRSWGLGIHRITNTPNNDIVLPGSSQMFGHTGEAYGLVSDAYFDTTRRIGLVFLTNGVGAGYTTGSNSAFYTIEKDIFDAVENNIQGQNCLNITANEILLPPTTKPISYVFESRVIHIRNENAEASNKIWIFNSMGQLIGVEDIGPGDVEVSLKEYPCGFYIARFNDETIKIIR